MTEHDGEKNSGKTIKSEGIDAIQGCEEAQTADATCSSVTQPTQKRPVSNIGRRSFVLGVGALAGLLCVGGIARASEPGDPLLRPPGGQDENAFLALCTRCDRCRSACPTEAIAPCNLEGGIVSMRTPHMNFKLGYCDFCGKCAEVCPTGALSCTPGNSFVVQGVPDHSFYETSQVLGHALINKDHCIIWTGQSTCIICSQSCPYGAIALDENNRPVVNIDICNGCGVCENVCPSSRLLSYEGGSTRGIEIQPQSVFGT